MKKTILTTAIVALGLMQVNAQYYSIPYQDGRNPGGVNTEGENPATLLTGWTTLWTGDATATATFTAKTAIPFAFQFNNNPVTHFKASNSGSVTFDTASTNLPAFGTTALPSASIPNNSVNVLGLKPSSWVSGSTTYRSAIITKTLGTAPRRQFWIQYNFFSEPNIDKGWTYWAVVLEETTNKIYLVDMKTLCLTAAGQVCQNNVKLSAGIQINGTTAYAIPGSPNLGAFNSTVNKFDASDNKYYEFVNGTQPAKDLSNISLGVPTNIGLNQVPFAITGKARNIGSAAVTSYKITYQINNETPVTSAAITTSTNSFDYLNYSHPTTWTPTTAGTYTVKVWISEVNGGADEANGNDTLTKNVTVYEALTVRRSLHEIFTSSTCPPCKPGNEQMHKVLNEKIGTYSVIKYQYFGPGAGDPYFTPECYNRGVYYGQTPSGTGGYSVPDLYVDGGWGNNPSGYTTSIYDGIQGKPAFMEITPTLTVTGKKVDVSATIKSLVDYPAGTYKVRIAIVEKLTSQNVKTNGETDFNYVLKKMLPNDAGSTITLPAKGQTTTINESFTFNGEYRLPVSARTSSSVVPTGSGYAGINLATEHSVEQFEDLAVVIFVQNDANKEVLQSAWTAQDFPVGVANVEEPASDLTIYPNPASSSIRIKLDAKQASVRIFDMNGKVIIKSSITDMNNVVNCDTLNNGLYFVEVATEDGKTTIQKLVINK